MSMKEFPILADPSKVPNKLLIHSLSNISNPIAVEGLIEQGNDANTKDCIGNTPLHYVVRDTDSHRDANIETIKVLLKSGADINAKNQYGTTPLHLASYYSTPRVVRFLINNGADINAKDECNRTSLHYASINNNFKVAKLLIDKGVDVNTADCHNKTPLHYATKYSDIEMVDLFLKNGANVNVKDEEGKTPLHYATERGLASIVKLLLENGANPNIEDNQGNIPLHIAVKNENIKTTNLLIKYGADILKKNTEGLTPIDIGTPKMKRFFCIKFITNNIDVDKLNINIDKKILGEDFQIEYIITASNNNKNVYEKRFFVKDGEILYILPTETELSNKQQIRLLERLQEEFEDEDEIVKQFTVNEIKYIKSFEDDFMEE